MLVDVKYGHLDAGQLEGFAAWLERAGWSVEFNVAHRPDAPVSLAVARFPDDALPVLIIRERKKRNVVGQLDILHDVCSLSTQYAIGLEHPDYGDKLTASRRKRPRAGAAGGKERKSISDFQPQEMREQFPVPFEIPPEIDLSCEARIYFAQRPHEFQEWLSMYRNTRRSLQ